MCTTFSTFCNHVIVDICAIAALLALGGMGKKLDPVAIVGEVQQTTNNAPQATAKPPSVQQQKNAALTQQENELAEKILAGTYGQPPAVRRIITEGNVRHQIAKKVLEYLVEQNKVKREGKQYQLVQSVIL